MGIGDHAARQYQRRGLSPSQRHPHDSIMVPAVMRYKAWVAKAAGQQMVLERIDLGPLGTEVGDVALDHAGVCRSDLAVVNSVRGISQYSAILGNEATGRITAVNPNTKRGSRLERTSASIVALVVARTTPPSLPASAVDNRAAGSRRFSIRNGFGLSGFRDCRTASLLYRRRRHRISLSRLDIASRRVTK